MISQRKSWGFPAFLEGPGEGGSTMKVRGAGGQRPPGEDAGGGNPSRPAREYGGVL